MKIFKFLVFFTIIKFIFCKNVHDNILHKFLLDYFEDRNVTVRLIVCWDHDEIKTMAYKFFNYKYPIQTYVHTNFNNVDFLELLQHNIYNIIDTSCDNSEYVLSKANEKIFFRAPHKWLLIPSKNYTFTSTAVYHDNYKNLLNPYDIQVDSEVACVEYTENNILVWYYYKENENRTIMRELHGTWNKSYGFQNKLIYNVTSYRRKNLRGTIIRMVCGFIDPNSKYHLEDFKYPTIDIVTKSVYGNIMALFNYLNSTVIIIPVDEWGFQDPVSKRWNGVSGVIQRKEADIVGSGMLFLKARLEVGKFLKLTIPTQIIFIFRKPPLSVEQNIYSLPFSLSVWISSVLLLILVTVVFILLSYFENLRNTDIEKLGFGNIVLLMAGAVCQQGCDVIPAGVSGRILTLLVFTAFMFLYVSYSANIVALLQSSSDSIKNMEDLLLSKSMKVGLKNIYYNYHFYQNGTDELAKRLYKEKIGPHGFYNVEEGVKRIKKGLFAFYTEEGAANYYILKTFEEHEKCDLSTVLGVVSEQFGWLMARFDSPHLEMFKVGLYKLGEYGIEQKFVKRFYQKPSCYSQGASFTSVGIGEFYPALVVFGYGLLISIFLLAFELIHKKCVNKHENELRKFDFQTK